MKKLIILLIIISFLLSPVFAYELLGVKWPGLNPVLSYYFDEQGCEDVPNEWEYLHRSFDVWTEVPTTIIETEYKGMVSVPGVAPFDGKNALQWVKAPDWPYGSCVIAVCSYWYNGDDFVEIDISFNSQDFVWSTDEVTNGKMDISHVAVHEIGHALGLGHSDVEGSVMWPTACYADTSNRHLHSDDSLGITVLYPRTNNNNRAPIITSTPITEAIAGMKYTYQVTAEDPDGDSIKYSLPLKHFNMRIDSLTGKITWFPKFLDLGTHNVTVKVTDAMNKSTTQSFTITVTNLVVYTVNDTVLPMDTLYWDVLVTPMDEYGVFAGNIEIAYDKEELVILEIDTIGSILAGTPFIKNIKPDTIKIAFAGAEVFTGSGILFRIKLMVYPESCGRPLSLPIVRAFFNDGDPVAITKNGTVFMPCYGEMLTVDGKVLYYGNNTGVGDAEVTFNELGRTVPTTEDGFFAFDNLQRMYHPINISGIKDSGDIRDAISAFDASLILRYIVDLHQLKSFPYQRECTDANANGMITAYDATLILRFIIGYNDATDIGEWVIHPKQVPICTSSVHNLVLKSYMIGDVSGDWKYLNDSRSKQRPVQPGSILFNKFVGDNINTDTGAVEGYTATISVDDITCDIYSGEFEIDFDSSQYAFYNAKPLLLLNGFISASNVVANKIKIAFAGTVPLPDKGDLFNIILVPKEEMAGDVSTPVSEISYCKFNESRNLMVNIGDNPKVLQSIQSTNISSIYPNPFRNKVSIDYTVQSKQNVKLLIFDLKGREIIKLINQEKKPGNYKVSWDGKDPRGNDFGTQIFVLKFISKDYTKTSKLYLIK